MALSLSVDVEFLGIDGFVGSFDWVTSSTGLSTLYDDNDTSKVFQEK